ncbi:MAG TPA: S41 family peptidase [Candidatus Baltobacteraceae bacterium]|nr:S41 family peptidase [Candidatus Baltobacteraceae bacterium]
MKRLSTLLLAAFLAATMLQLPTATAAPQGLTGTETTQISTSYTDLVSQYYKKVNAQAVLDSVHKELAATLAHRHLKGTLPRAFAGSNATNNERAIDLQVEAAQKIAGSHISSTLLTYAAIHGMMDSVRDRYTVFLSPKDYAELNGALDGGDFGGTGIVIQADDSKYIDVSNVVPDGPADKAGVQQDDLITRIDGVSTKGWSTDRASAHLRGKKGTRVTLTLVRNGKLLPSPITITRGTIHQMSVYERMLPGDIGYIALTVFGKSTTDELTTALDRLQKRGARAYIVDLRDNGGGYLDAAVGVSSKFISSGPIVSVESRASSITTLEANDTAVAPVPLVVLVNAHTASASEITSGAIQDSAVGTIMGTKTFGKGVVQTIYPLGDGSAVKITTARYLTPHNRDINHLGITPDVVVAENKGARYGDPKKDAQLARAISFINARIAQLNQADGVTPGN